jgi:hypothetical protein
MYVGTTAEINPTPKPPITLPTYSCARLVVLIAQHVCTTDPMRKMMSPKINARFRPLYHLVSSRIDAVMEIDLQVVANVERRKGTEEASGL